MIPAVLSALALLVPQEAAAAQDWPMFRGGPMLQGVAAGQLPDRLALRWTYDAGKAVTSSPAVVGDRVYFGGDDQKVHAVTRERGEAVWEYPTGDLIEAPPLVLEGVVYIGSGDGVFRAIDAAKGELRWEQATGDQITGGANWFRFADGTLAVVVGSHDGSLHCFEAATGKPRWQYSTDNFVNGTPAVLADRIVFGGCDTGLHQVGREDGADLGRLELGDGCHVAGSVAVAGMVAYVPHHANAVFAVDLARRELLWSYPSRDSFFSSPAVDADLVVIGGRDRSVHAMDRATGEPRWLGRTRRAVDASPVICGDKVVVGSGDGRLYLWRRTTGEEVWTYDVGADLVSSPAVAHGMVFVGCLDGKVYAFGAPEEAADG